MASVVKVVIASRNRGKIGEIRELLGGTGVELVEIADVCPDLELPENGTTFEENAASKALAVAKATGLVAIADDSGLEVDALGGSPGVFSARFAWSGSSSGRGERFRQAGGLRRRIDEANNRKLLDCLRTVPPERRTARFRCVVAVATPEGEVRTVQGICEGRIAPEARGTSGFGYDPLFIPDGCSLTFAELGEDEKNRISHRAKALREARKMLLELRQDLP